MRDATQQSRSTARSAAFSPRFLLIRTLFLSDAQSIRSTNCYSGSIVSSQTLFFSVSILFLVERNLDAALRELGREQRGARQLRRADGREVGRVREENRVATFHFIIVFNIDFIEGPLA